MEHREAPRSASAEEVDPRRFFRLVTAPVGRRVALSRLAPAALAGILALGLAVGVGSYTVRSVTRWLKGRPPYQTRFREIELRPAPPSWYRGGAPAFLDRVRESASIPDEPFSVLECDLDRLRTDFRKYAFVARVAQARCEPPAREGRARLVVHLQYREPVAVAQLSGRQEIVIDEEGVILPAAALDRELLGMLIPVVNLPPPLAPTFGQIWKVESRTPGIAEACVPATRAAKLAAFLKRRLAGESRPAALARAARISFDPAGAGPFVRFAEPDKWLFWGSVPGEEEPGQPTALEKWEKLLRWLKDNGSGAFEYPKYLGFKEAEILVLEGRSASSESH